MWKVKSFKRKRKSTSDQKIVNKALRKSNKELIEFKE